MTFFSLQLFMYLIDSIVVILSFFSFSFDGMKLLLPLFNLEFGLLQCHWMLFIIYSFVHSFILSLLRKLVASAITSRWRKNRNDSESMHARIGIYIVFALFCESSAHFVHLRYEIRPTFNWRHGKMAMKQTKKHQSTQFICVFYVCK